MASLERNLRKDLERAVKRARNVAEAGARQAIAQLGVGEAESPRHLTAEQRALRTGLRAHGRQLGDRRDPKTGAQATAHLAQECAYEHWHRMLFARFLAETDLLIEPESGVAISLDEVQELAREKRSDWLPLASEYAERMLPQIFRKDDPVLDIALPPETRSELEDLLKALPKAVFEADDSLGWVYQFWQAEKKDEVNKSEVKIGADELPAVTQLFTEDYMVLFLLHNTLGAWWAGKMLAGNPALAGSAASEDALRAACSVGDVDWTYLRFVRDKAEDGAEGPWRPAAGTLDSWPKAAKDITVLDPCMGSGHFLVFALPILVAFRMAEEGLSEREAIDAVLRDNLFGLEIDPRCTQIAAFNLAFAAWKRTGFYVLPQLNLACSGLAIGVTKAEWLKLAEKAVTVADPATKRDLLGVEQNLLTHGLEERVKNGLEALYDLFAKAPWLGSLIDPRRAGGDIFREGFDKLEPLLASLMAAADTDDAREIAVAAQGMAKAAELLGRKFTVVITNVPYLGRGKQAQTLADFVVGAFPDAKADLATAMLSRLMKLVAEGGTLASVTPQSWLFLGSYKKVRAAILKAMTLDLLVALGPRAFETISGEVVNTALIAASANQPVDASTFCGLDSIEAETLQKKKYELLLGKISILNQKEQRSDPEYKITVRQNLKIGQSLREIASVLVGATTGDSPRYIYKFWEWHEKSDTWEYFQTTVDRTANFGGMTDSILWERESGALYRFAESVRHLNHIAQNWRRGKPNWGRRGVSVSMMTQLEASIYTGERYDSNCCAIVPNDEEDTAAIWAYCASGKFFEEVRSFNQNLKVEVGTILSSKVDLAHWRKVAAERYPAGLPKPYSDDPTQWLFHGHPAKCGTGYTLQVGLARLLGYRWPAETDALMDLAPEAHELVAKCAAFEIDILSSDDGIICLSSTKGLPPAHERVVSILAEAFGAEWSAAKLANLLSEAGFSGKSVDEWLRDSFFEQHCELFHQRPFIWHIWDGRRDGFHALVNYHRLAAQNGEGRRTLEKLIYSYLGDWIDRQRDEQKAGVEGADARLAHAEHLRAELIKILEGEPPYDIFVRWKPLHEQPIGWDPDVNDGVRMNIRPFMTARPLGAKAKGACILRATPKIKWDKDRGKEPNRDKTDYPWFWGWNEASADFVGGATFDGNRWNDLHYSRAVKQATRKRHAAKAGAEP
ncbi:N-6 DNA methylase [Methylocystis sp. JR02]|uniref:Eco57I restriction-modification methylase domain-containing protein n=1 Tax=Methylocystis sp. JR02 TaxID=3046284 RepID=UPI0024BB40D3|nr:N-6 DNA methylase [Methylocystis sp. JR02]MDJ0448833.1 N-6 DNA methylase [Methylocystis sp. JR02]